MSRGALQVPFPACLRPADGVGEPPVSDGLPWNERHLQCVWADARLRPPLKTLDGIPVEVEDPGTWNGVAGPDFRGAVLRIGGEVRRGDVELHVHPRDWSLHGHTGNPDYDSVILHVAWFPPSGKEDVPAVPLVCLRDAMAARSGFSFDQVDPDAYPWLSGADVERPCRNALRDAPSAIVGETLAAAGRQRLRRKAREIARRLEACGSPDQTFYAEVLAALGFHRNAAPMRALAARVPAADLATHPDPFERYAMLLGAAGLLYREGEGRVPKDYLEALWAAAFRAGANDAAGSREGWSVAAVRPLNHPRVRLAVAASFFRTASGLRVSLERLPRQNGKVWVKLAAKTLRGAAEDAVRVLPPAMSAQKGFLGAGRIHTILVNAVLPLLSLDDSDAWRLLEAVPGEEPSSTMKGMAFRLLGGDHNPALWTGNALRMQGLLELWNGYCEASPESCRTCPLASR